MAESFVLVVFLMVALAAPLVLYLLVRGEHEKRDRMDRESAEQAARRDTGDRE